MELAKPLLEFVASQMRPLDADDIEGGYFEQRDYFPAFWDYWGEWSEAGAILADELAIISSLDRLDRLPETIDPALDAAWEEDDSWQMLGLDIGIAGLTATLCAAGLQTVYSCRGHGRYAHGAEYPQVRFFSDPERARILEQIVVNELGCSLGGPDAIGAGWLWAAELGPLLTVAALIHEESEMFKVLPVPSAVLSRSNGAGPWTP